jgi:hypothetical protein
MNSIYESLIYGYFTKPNHISLVNGIYHAFTHIFCVDIFVNYRLNILCRNHEESRNEIFFEYFL